MSREIKFRAWEEINKVMHFDFRFIKSGNEGNDWLIFTSDKQTLKDSHHPFDNPWFQQQFKVMQYTGIKDVNGVEIYEGDIVHWGHIKGFEECLPRKAVVEFSPDLTFSTFNLEKNHKFRFGNFAYRNTENSVEVIGNIYQNPEMAKHQGGAE